MLDDSDELKEYPSALSGSYTGGVVLGLWIIIITLMAFLLEANQDWWPTIVSGLGLLGIQWWAINEFRNKKHNGFLSFGKAMGLSTLMTVWASLIGGIFVWLFFGVIDPDTFTALIDQAKEEIWKGPQSEAEKRMAMEMMEGFMKPWIFGVFSFIGNVIFGVITSLIAAAIAHRSKPYSSDNY